MSEVQRLERIINVVIGKPMTWAVYGLVLAARYGCRGFVAWSSWLRQRYTASGA